MELRDLAEQVLFGTTLEDKLRLPAALTDERPGPSISAPHAPGRPRGLQFKSQVAQADPTGPKSLERPEETGRLLHLFANHELLAAELMALALLRFPEAPAAFRMGLARTLRDEQEHTRRYVERLRALGVAFGDRPVSGFFWRAVAPMETPVDYIARLSLTFEQANLDFARHFSREFSALGDHDTARLLDGIYTDEIAHVAYGLKWFRRWKRPGESDWDALCRQLKFPLSPRRAKGFAVNIDGRRAAGFDDAFISELEVCGASKGRTPAVYLFNPFAEGFIARGRAFAPVAAQAALARDLANLPQFLARQDDVVLTRRRPDTGFLARLQRAGFPAPEFVELQAGGGIDPAAPISTRKLGGLRPWAWSPDSVEILGPLFKNLTDGGCGPADRFNARVAALYAKSWSAAFFKRALRQWTEDANASDWLCRDFEVGVAVENMCDALGAVAEIRRRGHHRVVLKESLGLAGGNALRLWEPVISPAQEAWMANALHQGRALVVEPWLDRIADFSVQGEMGANGLALKGYAGLAVDARGQFQGNWAEADWARRAPKSARAPFAGQPAASRVFQFYEWLRPLLERELRAVGFLGPIGVDAFIYRDAAGAPRLKPVVEINPRFTMGRLTLELMRRVLPGSSGHFRIITLARARAGGASDLAAYARQLEAAHPVRLEGVPVPKIGAGVVCLNDPAAADRCLAVFEVRPSGALP